MKKTLDKTFWEGLVFLLVAAGYLYEITNIPSFFEMPGVPGPAAFPKLLGFVFGLGGCWLMGSALWKKIFTPAPASRPAPDASPSAQQPSAAEKRRQRLLFVALWLIILAYLIVWPLLGFPLATCILLILFFYLMEERRWPVLIALSLSISAALYFLFSKGLNVKLGLGVLAALFS